MCGPISVQTHYSSQVCQDTLLQMLGTGCPQNLNDTVFVALILCALSELEFHSHTLHHVTLWFLQPQWVAYASPLVMTWVG